MVIEVGRTDLSKVRDIRVSPGPLGDGRARLRIDAFALTSNNITYAVFGDAMQYWDFFPSDDPTTWGRIPVWGFAEVVESNSADCAVGERLYGYYPMASELVIEPGRADPRGLTDVAAHRAPMAGAYNRYVRCAPDPSYRADRERHQMLLYPLFFTSFLIDDTFVDTQREPQVIVSSASSKTAIGVAFLTQRRGGRAIGLTSERNRDFVTGLGVYDAVVTYDDVPAIDRASSVYVDIAGNGDVRHAVHTHLADELDASMTVGDTHWDHDAAATDHLPGPAPSFFFAPGRIKERTDEWGRVELERRTTEAWTAFADWADGWVKFEEASGADAVIAAYRQLLAGSTDPRTGLIGSLSRTE